MLICIRFRATNNSNGNPRRVYVVYNAETMGIEATIDEGYHGNSMVTKAYPELNMSNIPDVDVTLAQYKEFVKLAKN